MTQEYSMTDQELRSLVLQQFYDERRLEFSRPSSSWINADLDDNEIYRICDQLAECDLIRFKPNINGARGKITAHGIDSIEREDSPGEAIQFVSHHTTNVENSSNIIVGSDNSQAVGYSCDQIAKAIDSSSRPETDKAKSKNLLENDTSMSSSQRPTDILLRGLVLQSFYDKREYGVFLSPSTAWVGGKAPIEEVYRICSQLREHNLIKWQPFQSGGGIGQITAYGSDVIEGAKTSDIALQVTHNYTTIANSNNVIVGDQNVQIIQAAFDEIAHAIECYNGTDSEKAKSKSLFTQLLNSPVFAQVVGQATRYVLEHFR
jgi:hypothetical protein